MKRRHRLVELLDNRLPDGSFRAFPTNRFLATVMVMSTLVTAGIGYLLSNANAQSSQAASTAQLLNEQASGQLRASYDQAESDYLAYVIQQSEQDAQGMASWNSGVDTSDAGRWKAEASTWMKIAAQQAQAFPKDVRAQAATGRLRDPAGRSAFVAERSSPGTLLQAEADGQNDVSSAWGKLVAAYTAAITVVGIALFLFGSALALAGRNRLVFSAVGMALVVVSCIWVSVITPGGPRAASDAAALAYTHGIQLEAAAATPKQFEPAVEAFAAAIANRPGYGRAYEARADAENARGAVQLGYGIVTLVQQPWRDRAVQDEQQAYTLGLRDEGVLDGLSFGLYQQWLEKGVGVPAAQTVQLAAQVVQLDPENPLAWFNLATYQLASNDSSDAAPSYQTFLSHLLYTNTAAGTKRVEDNVQVAYVAAALSTLDELATSPAPAAHPGMLTTINHEIALLTATISTGQSGQPGADSHVTDASVSADHVRIQRDSNRASASFAPPAGWDPAHGEPNLTAKPVVVAWYQRTSASGRPASAWTALPQGTFWSKGTQSPLLYDAGSDRYFTGFSGLLIRRCLPPGQYRVDVFVAGHRLLSAATTDLGGANLIAHYRDELGIGVCVPPTWVVPQQEPLLPGVVDVVQSPDGGSAAVTVRLYVSRGDISGSSAGTISAEIKAVLALIIEQPAGFGVTLPAGLQSVSVQPAPAFFDLQDSVQVEYMGAGIEVRGVGGLTSDGAFELGIASGSPADFADGQSLSQVYDSFGRIS
jgi:tetratricopeptide (TPR) repeat protein